MQTKINKRIILEIQNNSYIIDISKIIWISKIYNGSNKIFFEITYNDNTTVEIYYWKETNINKTTEKEVIQFLTDVNKHIIQQIKSLTSSKNIFNL